MQAYIQMAVDCSAQLIGLHHAEAFPRFYRYHAYAYLYRQLIVWPFTFLPERCAPSHCR